METMDDILRQRSKIAKTNICYMDDKGNVVTEDKATKCIITEYDSEGRVINEIVSVREQNKKIESEGEER